MRVRSPLLGGEDADDAVLVGEHELVGRGVAVGGDLDRRALEVRVVEVGDGHAGVDDDAGRVVLGVRGAAGARCRRAGASLDGVIATPRDARVLASSPSKATNWIVRLVVGSWLVVLNATLRSAVWKSPIGASVAGAVG